MVQDMLKTLFYLMIAVPFLYMTLDVLVDLVKRGVQFYQRYARPILIQHLTSMFK